MLYTLSYHGWTLDTLYQCILDHEAALVDIRFTPRARWVPCWNRSALASTCGDRYTWVQELGNKAHKEKPRRIAIVDMDTGLARLEATMAVAPNAILLCGCPTLEECHRLTVAQEIETRWQVPVEHLQAPARRP